MNEVSLTSKEIGTRLEWRKRETDDDGCRWSLVLVGDHGEELWAVLSSPTPLEVRSPDEPAQPLTTLSSPRSALWRHMHDEHGLTLIESELDEIELLAKACSADEPPAEPVAWMSRINPGLVTTIRYEGESANWVPLYTRAAPPPVPEWQPIETAPYRTEVLVYLPDDGAKLTAYSDGIGWRHVETAKRLLEQPTHWHPLPDGPALTKAGEQA